MQHHKYVVNHCQASFDRTDIEICLAEGSLTEDQLRVLVDEQNGWHGKPSYDELMNPTDFSFVGGEIRVDCQKSAFWAVVCLIISTP